MTQLKPLAVIIRLSALGDVLLLAPFTQHLSRTHRVVLVTAPPLKSLASILPGVDEVAVLEKEDRAGANKNLVRRLNQAQPSLVVDLQNKPRTLLFRRKIRAERKVVLKKRTLQQALFAVFGRDTVLDDVDQATRYLKVLPENAAAVSSLPSNIRLPDAWVGQTADFYKRVVGRGDLPVVGFAFSARHATKCWPVDEAFAFLTKIQETANVVLVGGPGDRGRLEQIQARFSGRPPADTLALSLEDLAGLVSRLDLLVGMDTGPIHLARLLGVRTVTLFGPTSWRRWGPGTFDVANHRTLSAGLDCQPCSNHGGNICPLNHHACMKELRAPEVLDEVIGLLGADDE